MVRLFFLVLVFFAGIPCLFSYTLTAVNSSGACGGAADVVVLVSIDDAAGMRAYQFDLNYDATRIVALSAANTTLTSTWTLVANTQQSGKVSIGAASSTPIGGGSGAIVGVHFRVLAVASGATSPLDLENAFVNEASATVVDGTFTVTCRGDANGDGSLTASDIFYLINFLFASGPPAVSGDANSDGSVTSGDIFFLINHLFANGPAPA